MLEDPDEGVRGRTVEELGKDVTTYAEQRASLEEMINDPDPWVRYVAESNSVKLRRRRPPREDGTSCWLALSWRWAHGFARLTARASACSS